MICGNCFRLSCVLTEVILMKTIDNTNTNQSFHAE
jgi:hypothetical protein